VSAGAAAFRNKPEPKKAATTPCAKNWRSLAIYMKAGLPAPDYVF
jgi:hypothetical protein